MHRRVACILAFLCVGHAALAAPRETPRDLSTRLMHATFKLEGEGSTGTAFIVGKTSKTTPRWSHYVLITAGHVLRAMKTDEAILHLRRRSGDQYEPAPLRLAVRTNGKPRWLEHPRVDVAAMYVPIPPETDIIVLNDVNLFANDRILKEAGIHAGDRLFALGYPFGAESNEAGFPILRSGAIASYPITPTDRVGTFLFDFEIRKGNSGGPVFFYQEGRLVGGAYPPRNFSFIMGMVCDEKVITEEVKSMYQRREEVHPINMAVVVHASLIKETIDMLPAQEGPRPAKP